MSGASRYFAENRGATLLKISGVRSVAAGNNGHLLNTTLNSLASGSYFWSVQTVDAGFAASDWSGDQPFVIDTVPPAVSDFNLSRQQAGIGQTINLALEFVDEHSGVDASVPPTVQATVEGQVLDFRELQFTGTTWSGELTITPDAPSGTATVSVRGIIDGKANALIPFDRAEAFEIDTVLPSVIASEPAGEASDVTPATRIISIEFSEPIDEATIDQSFEISIGNTALALAEAPSYDTETNTVVLTPTESLRAGTAYTVEISSAIQDLAGNRPENAITLVFSTAVPQLDSSLPAADETGVSADLEELTASFSVSLDADQVTAENFALLRDGQAVVLRDGDPIDRGDGVYGLAPAAGWRVGTLYSVTIASAVAGPLRSLGDGDFAWSFSTAVPQLLESSPAAGATDVGTADDRISATFDGGILTSVLAAEDAVQVSRGGERLPLSDVPVFDGETNTLSFEISEGLRPGTRYDVVLGGLLGGPLRALGDGDFSWSFSTAVPQLVSVSPTDGAPGIGVDLEEAAGTFSVALDPDLVTASNFQILRDGEPATLRAGDPVMRDAGVYALAPENGWQVGSSYAVLIAPGVTGPLGTSEAISWRFQTAIPAVSSLTPSAGASSVSAAEATLAIAFDNPIDDSALRDDGSVVITRQGQEIAVDEPAYNPDTRTVTFAPVEGLRVGSDYSVTIASAIAGPLRAVGGGDFSWSFSTVVPELISSQPAADDADVNVDFEELTTSFSVALDPGQVTSENFVLLREGQPVVLRDGDPIERDGGVYGLAPAAGWRVGTRYSVTIASAVAGPLRALGDGDFTLSFSTAVPELISSQPAADDADVNVDFEELTASFSVALDPDQVTAENFALFRDGQAVALRDGDPIERGGGQYGLAPDAGWRVGTLYSVTIASAVAGPLRALGDGDFTLSFSTAVPRLVSSLPAADETGVNVALDEVTASFSVALDADQVTAENFALFREGQPEALRDGDPIERDGGVYGLAAAAGWRAGTLYSVQIAPGVTGPLGVSSPIAWQFETAIPSVVETSPVDGASISAGPRRVRVVFSDPIDADLVMNARNFQLSKAGVALNLPDAEFIYDGASRNVSLPEVELVSGSAYEVTVLSQVRGPRGADAAATTWRFTTDLPVVSGTEPESEAAGISTSEPLVRIDFSGPIALPGETGFRLQSRSLDDVLSLGDGNVPFENARVTGFVVDPSLTSVSFAPDGGLRPFTEYRIDIDAAVFGELADRGFEFAFSTAARLDDAGNGGVITTADRKVELYFPPNALSGSTGEVVIRPLANAAEGSPKQATQEPTAVGSAYEIDAAGGVLLKPATLTLRYDSGDLGDRDATRLGIFRLADGNWVRVGGTAAPAAREVRTTVEVLGTYGLFEDLAAALGAVAIQAVDCQPRAFSPTGGARREETDISFELTAATDITIRVYNASGRLERVIVRDRAMARGRNSLAWDGRDEDRKTVASGLYVVVVSGGDAQAEKVVAVVR